MAKSKGLEEEIWSAISAFEQILEAMPNDRASLEALTHAYEQIGDHTRSAEYAMQLAEVVIDSGDDKAAAELVEKLQPHAEGSDDVAATLARLQSVAAGRSADPLGSAPGAGGSCRLRCHGIRRRGAGASRGGWLGRGRPDEEARSPAAGALSRCRARS